MCQSRLWLWRYPWLFFNSGLWIESYWGECYHRIFFHLTIITFTKVVVVSGKGYALYLREETSQFEWLTHWLTRRFIYILGFFIIWFTVESVDPWLLSWLLVGLLIGLPICLKDCQTISHWFYFIKTFKK